MSPVSRLHAGARRLLQEVQEHRPRRPARDHLRQLRPQRGQLQVVLRRDAVARRALRRPGDPGRSYSRVSDDVFSVVYARQ